jgi:drug/metabolite transporter (DMT)-like permease
VDPHLAAPTPPPPGPTRPRYTPWLLFAGVALLILSQVFPWSLQPFIPSDQQAGLYATGISVPAVLSRGFFELSAPTAAQVIAVLVLIAAVLLVVPSRWADVLRRVIGGVALLLFGLFAWRLSQLLSAGVPEGLPGFPAVLRAGFYLGVVGAILLIAAPGPKADRSPVGS